MATIRDVALRAGVSASTVSYVLTGNKRLSPATVERVRASIRELGYRPDPAARAMSLGRTDVIALLTHVEAHGSEVDADIFMRFVRSALFSARDRGFDLMVMGKDITERALPPLVDALLVMDVRLHDERLDAVAQLGLPTVLIGHPEDARGIPAVDLDFRAAGALAVEHLARRGARGVAVLVGRGYERGEALSFEARLEAGARSAGERLGLPVHQAGAGASSAEVARWAEGARRVLGTLDAVVVVNVAALDALLRHLGLEHDAPQLRDRVVVLAPDERMALSHPHVPVVDLPGSQMMATAVELVLHRLGGGDPPALTLLPPRLLARDGDGDEA